MITSLEALIPQVLNTSHDWRLQLLQNWHTIVGSLKTRICLEHIYGTVVVIGVYETHWIQELNCLSRVLLQAINASLGQERVTQIKFRHSAKRSYPKPTRPLAPTVCVQAEINFTPEQRRMLERIGDQALCTALTAFFIRCTAV